ncbi:helix-turn-helix domain-containing protein [Paenibacillus sp. HJL G12]|uniref:Helix-turn-helix domain-containing protein n=2 Tax=Paenibacillus dendrobii TaxID=2691084 RepID=A0A7X3II45_9BACL|nr:helix-turn-helix domain-containing protein [Paenibacillus dendrobii]
MDIIRFCHLSDMDKRLPVYVTMTGQWDHQEPVHRPDGFAYYQWLLILSGEGILDVDGCVYNVKAGQAICLFPGVPHRYHAVDKPWKLMFISMDGSLCAPLLKQAGITLSHVYTVLNVEKMKTDISRLITSAGSSDSFTGAECSKWLYSFLLDLPRHIYPNQHTQHFERLQPVVRYIRQHCHLPLTIQLLAEQAHVTPQYLCMLFQKAFHMRPMEYVNRERIYISKELIALEPHLQIQEIARRSGFEHTSYFCTVFKRLEGLTPQQFKQSYFL